jgi:hypothetical protein
VAVVVTEAKHVETRVPLSGALRAPREPWDSCVEAAACHKVGRGGCRDNVPARLEPPEPHRPGLCALRVSPWDSCVEAAVCHKVGRGGCRDNVPT